MALPVVIVASGGLPVTEIAAGGPGLPVVVASIGLPITVIAIGGLPVIGSGAGGSEDAPTLQFDDELNSQLLVLLEDF